MLEHGHGHDHVSPQVIEDGISPVSDCDEDSISKVRVDESSLYLARRLSIADFSTMITSIHALKPLHLCTSMTTKTAMAIVIAIVTEMIMATWA